MPIKSFRGQLADGGQDRIRLSTNDGMTGYRIEKFQIIQSEPGQQEAEHTVKIYTIQQTTINNNINFTDPHLLGVAHFKLHDGTGYAVSDIVIFDQKIVNQDIFVTHEDTNASLACNYYIELEQVKLNKNSQSVVTLKDIRANTA